MHLLQDVGGNRETDPWWGAFEHSGAADPCLNPFNTDSEDCSIGSGRPMEICMLRSAER